MWNDQELIDCLNENAERAVGVMERITPTSLMENRPDALKVTFSPRN